MFLWYGSATWISLCISSSISRCMGMQIPPEDPETWSPGLSRKGVLEENLMWSPGYFVSSVGVDEATIKQYVEYQGRKDSDQLRQEL